MNAVFRRIMADMDPELRKRIESMEKAGLYGKGKIFERARYLSDYMTAAWEEVIVGSARAAMQDDQWRTLTEYRVVDEDTLGVDEAFLERVNGGCLRAEVRRGQ